MGQRREHVLAGRDLAGRAAPPARVSLHQFQPRPGRLHPPARLHLGRPTYNAGLSATTTSGTDILGGYYRFAAYRNERFEIGPTVGFGYLW